MQFFQKGITGLSTKILLIIIAITFVLWGVGTTTDMLRNDGGEWALKVGDVTYSPQEWKHIMDKAMTMESKADPLLVRQGVVDDMIKSAIILQEAQRLNLLISDDMVKSEIAIMPAFRDQDGRFNKEAFDRTIKNSGLSELAFIQKIKEQMMRTQLIEFFFSSSSVVAPQFVDFTLRSMYGERIIKVFKLNTKAIDANSIASPTEEDLKNFILENKELYEIPEKREISYAIIDNNSLVSTPLITNDEIEKQYEVNKETLYSEPERRTFKQLIVKSYEEAKSLVEDFRQAKKTFEAELTKRSNSQAAPTELKDMTASGFDEQIARILFDPKYLEGQISDPLQTPIGWHIFKLSHISPKHVKTFEEVKNNIKEQLQSEKNFEALSTLVDKVNQDIAANKAWEDITQAYNLKEKQLQLIVNQDPSLIQDKLLQQAEFLQTVFTTEKISPAMPINNSGKFVVFNIIKVTPSYLPDLDSIKPSVIAAWHQGQVRIKLVAMIDSIQHEIEETEDLNSVISKYNDLINQKKMSIYDKGLSYVKPMPSDLPQALIEEILESEVGKVSNPFTKEGDDNYYFAQLIRIDDIPEAVLSELRNRFGSNIARMYQEMLFNEYIKGLHKNYKIEINHQIIK